jgi:drug/metabolite transporter (DMT)-like permease
MSKKPVNSQTQGLLAIVVTAFLWSIAGLFIKLVQWHPFAIAGLRSLIASLVILAFLKRPRLNFSFNQVAAALANAATMLLFVAANKTTTAANAILLQYVCPVFTAFFGMVLLKEKTHPEHWGAIVLVIGGMVMLFLDKLGGGHLPGNILALASALTFSFFFIFMRKQKDGSPLESILISHWITAAVGLTVSLFLPFPSITLTSLGAIAVLGIFQVGVAGLLFNYGIKRIPAVNANLIAVIEPVFNPVWVFLVIGEKPSLNTLIGGAVILFAVTAASVIGIRRQSAVPVENQERQLESFR